MNNNFTYFPIIKTRDSELRCFRNLSEDVLKKNPAYLRVDKIAKNKTISGWRYL